MAFDQSTRNRLQKLVSDCRKLLSEEFSIQLQQTYGIDPNSGEVADLDRLTHLCDRDRQTAQLLRDTLAHYLAVDADDKAHRIAAIDRIIREQAFTVLNRLAALLMMEARGLLAAAVVSQGQQSQAFELYKMVSGSSLGETGEVYRTFLFSLFDEFAIDLPALFDRYAAQGRLFPREPVLLEVLDVLNHHEIQPLWAEDETIGWIYQYFNSKEERRAMRDASQAPRNSRELAVRNQFFTPRYVVELLVDNTLGRIWFNATGGQTKLRECCQYLMVKPDEHPQTSAHLRDPRTLKLLDPACGSMHFGLYAFDLFLQIYQEAWDWEQANGPGSLDVSTQPKTSFLPLCQTYTDLEAYLRDVPRLIVEHNIYGVDIDPRAAQIASLALWLRAQRAWHDAGVKALLRPEVGRGQIVAAVPPPGGKGLRLKFASKLDGNDALLFEKTLQLLKGLPELGVLLRAEIELPHLIRQVYGGAGWGLFAEEELETWQVAEERLRSSLVEFSEQYNETYQGRLFARDTLECLRLVDLVGEKFDVIVMNPPFGAVSEGAKGYVFKEYPLDKIEIAACFVSRCQELLSDKGLVGAITSRTFIFSESFQRWRESFMSGLDICADLGFGVLDALVETAAYTICHNHDGVAKFIPLVNSPQKERDLLDSVSKERGFSGGDGKIIFRPRSSFSKFGTEWFYYWLSESLLASAEKMEARKSGVIGKSGLQTCDNFRFVRLAWECAVSTGFDKDWPRLTKGGEYQPFWGDVYLVANWRSDGSEMKAFIEASYQSWSKQIPSVNLYFKPGLTYSERTTSSLSLRVLPEGCLFDKKGPYVGRGAGCDNQEDMLVFLGLSYTYIFRCLVDSRVGLRDATEAGSPARDYMPSMVERLPLPSLNDAERKNVVQWVRGCIDTHRWMGSLSVTDSLHCGFPGLASAQSLQDYLVVLGGKLAERLKLLYVGLEFSDRLMNDRFGLSVVEHSMLVGTFGPEINPYQDCTDAEGLDGVDEYIRLPESELVNLVGNKYGLFTNILKQSYVGSRKLELISYLCGVSPLKVIDRVGSLEWLFDGRDVCENILDYFVGVAFGRWDLSNCFGWNDSFDESLPFNKIPVVPPGFVINKNHSGSGVILVDDAGSSFDLVSRVHGVCERLWSANGDMDRCQKIENEILDKLNVYDFRSYFKDSSRFFDDHLKRYSKSRRKAPIYWPLATASGSYTLWLYYPGLSDQTLFTAVNDFVDPKLVDVRKELQTLRDKGAGRSKQDEKSLEALASLEHELADLRDSLLEIAPNYRPNHDDGVQITAAPLWKLFRHKAWQKVLKDTWAKLENGDYDWAHLAMNYWPDRVRDKCVTDKSLAIAHGLENLYVEPEPVEKKTRGRKKAGSTE
ncbi:BREX-1 system adenine-specific DNA-methyltransferase PglX [Ectopseudomonas mendocina]|uniref:site-specific DNA-methyltransferase (adenine-specific) n=1 Tax=Ectopseudomonas mendocina TaxID=300 RepID=A0ABZ2RE84_ECTME